ncbi:expressed unknown protein [Seminavis robusta]|uniref:Uncharacterized protein n=1 Tax=Seminavis robusta TaxID=568900 RepID=A0A9N8D8W8_9STRA|nr:expressed unknown protein [Seminavis robusta]|eukprot:Sro34_g022120.1 n/a (641) ;mRNA; f:145143-147213
MAKDSTCGAEPPSLNFSRTRSGEVVNPGNGHRKDGRYFPTNSPRDPRTGTGTVTPASPSCLAKTRTMALSVEVEQASTVTEVPVVPVHVPVPVATSTGRTSRRSRIANRSKTNDGIVGFRNNINPNPNLGNPRMAMTSPYQNQLYQHNGNGGLSGSSGRLATIGNGNANANGTGGLRRRNSFNDSLSSMSSLEDSWSNFNDSNNNNNSNNNQKNKQNFQNKSMLHLAPPISKRNNQGLNQGNILFFEDEDDDEDEPPTAIAFPNNVHVRKPKLSRQTTAPSAFTMPKAAAPYARQYSNGSSQNKNTTTTTTTTTTSTTMAMHREPSQLKIVAGQRRRSVNDYSPSGVTMLTTNNASTHSNTVVSQPSISTPRNPPRRAHTMNEESNRSAGSQGRRMVALRGRMNMNTTMSMNEDSNQSHGNGSQGSRVGMRRMAAINRTQSNPASLASSNYNRRQQQQQHEQQQQQQQQDTQFRRSIGTSMHRGSPTRPTPPERTYSTGPPRIITTTNNTNTQVEPTHRNSNISRNSNSSNQSFSSNNSYSNNNTMIEIQPGLEAPLRNTQETMEAIACNFVTETSCLACTVQLYHIANAKFYICPACRVVSPTFSEHRDEHGVGLGFSQETLRESQHSAGQSMRNRYSY